VVPWLGGAIVAVIGLCAKVLLPMNYASKVVEQGAKIGLDNVELSLHHRHNIGKIINNFRPMMGSFLRALLSIGAHAQTIIGWMQLAVPNSPGS
jgi:hypothetical protein